MGNGGDCGHSGKHSHGHSHDHSRAGRNIIVAFWLNLSFGLIEIAGGILTNSVAILSDALHDLGDSFSLGLAWYFEKVSRKKSDARFSYGYRRFSLLGAMINSAVLLVGSIFIIGEAVRRIAEPQQPDAKGMLLLAVLGIIVNGAAVIRLSRGRSLNERAVSLHLLEDVLGWTAVLIGSIVMMFADLPIIDPILSIGIACFILFNIYRNLRDTMRVVLQGIPDGVSGAEIGKSILSAPGVESLHDLHIWTMDGEYNILTVHVVADAESNEAELKKNIRNILSGHNIHHATIEVDGPDEHCGMEQCG